MSHTTSPTWSVYDAVWPMSDPVSSSPIPYIDGPPEAMSLRGCGLVKEALLQHGAQGAIYAAHTHRASGEDGDCAPQSPPPRFAVKRLFTQTNDFGRRGVEETVLREATMLRFINQRAQEHHKVVPAPPASDSTRPFTFGQDDSIKVITLYRVVEAPHTEMCLVMELCASDLRRLTMDKPTLANPAGPRTETRCQRLSQPPVLRYLLRRMLAVLQFLHNDCHVLHRDIKLSNFLVLANGELRLADFGSARFLCDESAQGLAQAGGSAPRVAYSPASTRTTMLYQPPETLMGSQTYGTALDVWGLGVMLGELILQKHLFTAESELALLGAIWKLLGAPNSSSAEGSSESAKPTFDVKFSTAVVPAEGADLLRRMLTLVPEQRITVEEALRHPFLAFDGAQQDDAEGARLWREKVELALQKREESVRVRMPTLSLGANNDDDDDDTGSENDGVGWVGGHGGRTLTPPNFTLQLF